MPSPPLGITASQDHFSASGGTVTSAGGYTIHTFTASGTFTIGAKGCREIEWEVIGGGGAGDYGMDTKYGRAGGGGGAGGYITGSETLSPHYSGSGVVTAIPVTVGAGGSKGTGFSPGNPSSFKRTNNNPPEMTLNGSKTGASGGGSGFYDQISPGPADDGRPRNNWGIYDGYSGSGGGGTRMLLAYEGASGYGPNGNKGGNATDSSVGAGGGGGAGGSANNTNMSRTNFNDGTDGGIGVAGVCGGGGGGSQSAAGGLASSGGGAGGATLTAGSDGAVNTGGGGGGGGGLSNSNGNSTYLGGNGGSGKVIIKYKTV